jgi:phytoene dehydrogenase-like protein
MRNDQGTVNPSCARDESTRSVDVAVIGAGLAGLTAAAWAARGGARVRLLERAATLGGRGASRREGDFLFNVGPHALYRGGLAEEVLGELGVAFSGRRPPTSGALAWHGGGLHTLPGGFVSLLTTDLLSLGGKLELARLFTGLARIDTEALAGRTVADWLGRQVGDATVRQMLAALLRLTSYANDPERAAAAAAVAQLQEGLARGVRYIDGGWQTLIDGLETSAIEAGVDIRRSTRVAALRAPESTDAGWELETGDGARLRAGAVVLAVPPAAAAACLQGAIAEPVAAWARELVPVKAACLDLALRRLPRPRRTFVLGIDRPLYFSVHSASARLAPEGAALVHVANYLGPREQDPAEVRAELEALCDAVQPGWRDEVVEQRYLPSITVTGALVAAGSVRPGPEVPGRPGLFVAGDWVGSEGMLADTALASGRRAGRLAAAAAQSATKAVAPVYDAA